MNESTQKRNAWVIAPFVVAGAVAVMLAAITLMSDDETEIQGLAPAGSELESARESCSAGELGDDGTTLVLDMEGEEPGSGTLTFADVTCVLAELEVPTSVTSRMEQTRALDGMQDARWKGFSATWNYHPDSGMNLVITTDSSGF